MTVLAPRGYTEWGGTNPNFNWVGPFEKSTGCRVNLRYTPVLDQTAAGSDNKYEKYDDAFAQASSYDVVAAPPEVAGRLIADKKVAPLTTSLISHYDEIPQWLRSQKAITHGRQVYGVPYLWGTYVTVYGSDMTAPKGGALYAQRALVALRDSPLSIADAALALKSERPALGIEDPFQLSRQQFDAAAALVAEGRGGERSYWRGPSDAFQEFAGGDVRAGRTPAYQFTMLRGAARPVKAVTGEPTTGWVDSWMVSAQAAAPNCAYRWLDWASSAKAQQPAAAWNSMAPANPKACDLKTKQAVDTGQSDLAERVCAAYRVGDDAWLREVSFATRPSSDCGGRDGECIDYAKWAETWQGLVR